MSERLGAAIAAVLTGAGEGLAGLRRTGSDLEISECAIEVLIDDADPSAHVRLTLAEAKRRSSE
jgi:hypothetical protein